MTDIMKFIMDDKLIDTDPQGYLLNLNDWSEDVARAIAKEDNIELTDDHWEVLHFLRKHYSEFGTSPNARLLVKTFSKAFGEEKGNKKKLYQLFPNGPSRTGCRIAGLPLPNDCVDWPA